MFERSSGDFVGYCGVVRAPGRDFDELIYVFHQRFWGCGYATEAGRAMVDHVFTISSLDEIAATIDPDNHASIRVAGKLGMVEQHGRVVDGDEQSRFFAVTREQHAAR